MRVMPKKSLPSRTTSARGTADLVLSSTPVVSAARIAPEPARASGSTPSSHRPASSGATAAARPATRSKSSRPLSGAPVSAIITCGADGVCCLQVLSGRGGDVLRFLALCVPHSGCRASTPCAPCGLHTSCKSLSATRQNVEQGGGEWCVRVARSLCSCACAAFNGHTVVMRSVPTARNGLDGYR